MSKAASPSQGAQRLYQEYDLEKFVRNYCEEELHAIQEKPRKRDFWVSYDDVLRFEMGLADILSGYRTDFHPEDLADAISHVVFDADDALDPYPSRDDATVRFHDFPDEEIMDVGEWWASEHANQYIAVAGQIQKRTAKRPYYEQRVYECARCGAKTIVPGWDGEAEEPNRCQSCEREGPFITDDTNSDTTVIDVRRMRMQNPPDKEGAGTEEQLDVVVRGSLLRWMRDHGIEAGSRVVMYGILTSEESGGTKRYLLEARAVDPLDDDLSNLDPGPEEREEIEAFADGEHGDPYELLAESVAPSLKGVDVVEGVEYRGEEKPKLWWLKLGAAVAGLFQGFRKNVDNPERGTSHVLMVGDPSTGKSTIMDHVAELSPRSSKVSGKGASAAGMTAAAVQDDLGDGNRWTLEAGALVQGHGGVAAVDELDKMQPDAVSSLHGALESQRVEISKAGINATLKAETAMVAAANPRDSRFDEYGEALHEQIDLVGSLMDRFDLVWTLQDTHYEERDRAIAEHRITGWTEAGLVERGDKDPEESAIAPAVPVETLRSWVSMARQLKPVPVDPEVREVLEDFYVEIRSQNDSSGLEDAPVPATTRDLEGSLRLSEAIARVELSETVEMHHAEIAMALIRASLQDIGYDPDTGMIDIDRAEGRTPQSQRQRIKTVKGIIDELETADAGADIDEVLDEAEDIGIERSKAEHTLEKIKHRGEAYEPKTNKEVRLS